MASERYAWLLFVFLLPESGFVHALLPRLADIVSHVWKSVGQKHNSPKPLDLEL